MHGGFERWDEVGGEFDGGGGVRWRGGEVRSWIVMEVDGVD